MPRFPIAFSKRKSTADNLDDAQVAGPSFRVLDRTEVGAGGRQSGFDGGARLSGKGYLAPRTSVVPDTSSLDDNIFADLKTNRGSGSSNTTKGTSTDNSSRHSNASTAPSSADMNTNQQNQTSNEDWRNNVRKTSYDHIPLPPVPKSSSSGFLKAAGRSFSFGGKNKSSQPATLVEEPHQMDEPPLPPAHDDYSERPRATTSSTVSTAMPPKVDQDFTLDLGGDFSRMLLGGDKRQSVMTLREQPNQQAAPRSLTGGRQTQPSPLQLDQTSRIEPSPFSWGSRHSDDHLLTTSPITSPVGNGPPVPRHGSPLADRSQNPASSLDVKKQEKKKSGFFGRKSTTPEEQDVEEEDARLLKESLSSVNKFLAGNTAADSQNSGRYRRNEELPSSGYRQVSSESRVSRLDKMEDDNMFSTSLAHSSRVAQRYVARKPSPPRNKVMTPAQFERYRKDKERQDSTSEATKPEVRADDDDDEDHYEDDDDEVEKTKKATQLRRKQEAHMTVYRQQMMKVTGEQSSASNTFQGRPHIPMSLSSPNLGINANGPSPTGTNDPSDEDEEVPLAILAAHGFPNKNRPPTRLSTMMSNPNLQQAAAPSYQRPMSVAGDAAAGTSGGRLPAFAKNLPQDPYLGAGLIHQAPREQFALSGGAPAAGVPPGGLVGVIASEERSRAMRRGSPALDARNNMPLPQMGQPQQQFDPMGGIPPQMMYPGGMGMPGQQMPGMMTPQDQAQMQMNQQMQQFMQMQMQFMQMQMGMNGQQRPGSQHGMGMGGMMGPGGMGMGGMPGMMPPMGMGGNPDMRHSFVDNGSMMDLPMPQRPDHTRTMSLVQPSSASWVQPPPQMPAGYAPSIRIQGINGGAYAPSIAPSERSNIGLPGRYRPVSQMPGAATDPNLHLRKSSTMSGALGGPGWDHMRKTSSKSPSSPLGSTPSQPSQGKAEKKSEEEDEDDEEAWAAMQAKREKKKGLWKSKKGFRADLAALIS